jgi:hypothetical protein
MTLLEKCNADVYKAILDIKQENPALGEKLITTLQIHQYWWQIPVGDVMWFAAHLPSGIWNLKINSFPILFESQQTTVMP